MTAGVKSSCKCYSFNFRQAVQEDHMITHGDYDEDKRVLEIIKLYLGSRVTF